jgi:hypothetical protein
VVSRKIKIALMLSLFVSIIILSIFLVSAHEGEVHEEVDPQVEISKSIEKLSLKVLFLSGLVSSLFILFAIFSKKKAMKHKKFIFIGIIIPIIIGTLFLTGGTIYKNVVSDTNGPVHWHADFEIWDCGNSIDIINPTGLSNRVGTRLYHEHADNRVHVEGTVLELSDIDLETFFEVLGGELTKEKLVVPTNEGVLERSNGDLCNGQESSWQVFVYKTTNGVVIQEKLDDFPHYVLSPYAYVPPGDCLILEFGEEKESTTNICETYRIAIEEGDVIGS